MKKLELIRGINSLFNKKRLCSTNKRKETDFFITTPIFYVNSVPHIGHVFTALLADAQNRFQKLLGVTSSFLSTGTDEHGMKILQAATKNGMQAQDFCDKISIQFKDVFQEMNIDYNVFFRTTSIDHKKSVQHFYKQINDRGYVYSGTYEGWYCTSDEMFLTSTHLIDVKDPVTGKMKKLSSLSGQEVEWTSECNYMFKLSQFKDDLLHWLKNENVIKPKIFQNILINDIYENLRDISISRDRSRLPWGIPVPDDDSQTIYVWLDALINYLTVRGYPDSKFQHWPPDYHVIGKEILKFHGIYWPAFLMAAGLEPPRHLLVHSHWLVDHQKMSKSKGNSITPMSRIDSYTAEGLRYYLLREGVPHSDSNYSDVKVEKYLNSELANTLGNLLNRCTSTTLNQGQIFRPICRDTYRQYSSADGESLVEAVDGLADSVAEHYTNFNFYHGLEEIMTVLRQANLFLQSQKPWEFKNDEKRLSTIISVAMETLRVCGILLQPIVPVLSDKLLSRLGVSNERRTWHDAENNFIALKSDVRIDDVRLGDNTGVFFQKVKLEEPVLQAKESVVK
uniref:Methionine--tRNA ligase, mitochondrial n=1 Tax=Strigamia maritima TaxID=126957 RepID=T1IW11_STRMM